MSAFSLIFWDVLLMQPIEKMYYLTEQPLSVGDPHSRLKIQVADTKYMPGDAKMMRMQKVLLYFS